MAAGHMPALTPAQASSFQKKRLAEGADRPRRWWRRLMRTLGRPAIMSLLVSVSIPTVPPTSCLVQADSCASAWLAHLSCLRQVVRDGLCAQRLLQGGLCAAASPERSGYSLCAAAHAQRLEAARARSLMSSCLSSAT